MFLAAPTVEESLKRSTLRAYQVYRNEWKNSNSQGFCLYPKDDVTPINQGFVIIGPVLDTISTDLHGVAPDFLAEPDYLSHFLFTPPYFPHTSCRNIYATKPGFYILGIDLLMYSNSIGRDSSN